MTSKVEQEMAIEDNMLKTIVKKRKLREKTISFDFIELQVDYLPMKLLEETGLQNQTKAPN